MGGSLTVNETQVTGGWTTCIIGDLSYSKTDWNWDLNNLKSSKTTKIYSYY